MKSIEKDKEQKTGIIERKERITTDKYLESAQRTLNVGLPLVGTFKHCIRNAAPRNSKVI
jgi:hypothetical protein